MSAEPTPTILIDSREQLPWTFPPEIRVERRTLSSGDYTVEGLEDRIAIERKTLGDFTSTVIGQWIRFAKELHRLMSYDCAIIVVEATLEDITEHRYESDVNPNSVKGRMAQCFIDYQIPVMLWGKREDAQAMALRFLKLAWRRYGK